MVITAFKGNYLSWVAQEDKPKGCVTLAHFIGEEGMARVKLVSEKNIPWKLDWKPFTLRGYGKLVTIPAGLIDLTDGELAWNYRYPENGGIIFYKEKWERDAMLIGDNP